MTRRRHSFPPLTNEGEPAMLNGVHAYALDCDACGTSFETLSRDPDWLAVVARKRGWWFGGHDWLTGEANALCPGCAPADDRPTSTVDAPTNVS